MCILECVLIFDSFSFSMRKVTLALKAGVDLMEGIDHGELAMEVVKESREEGREWFVSFLSSSSFFF